MKKIALIWIATILFISTSVFSAVDLTYNGIGAGGSISFALSEYDNEAFGFGVHGVLEFSLGNIGIFQYYPNFAFWFNINTQVPYETPFYRREIKVVNRQTGLNFFDAKYLFPVPATLVVKPYAGFGFCIITNGWSEEIIEFDKVNDTKTYSHDSYRDTDLGFNMFSGIDFKVSERFVPVVELRFTATDEWTFRMTGGFTIRF